MLAPGLGSARLPVKARLLVALALSLSLVPLLAGAVVEDMREVAREVKLLLVVNEVMIGITFGLITRCFLLGAQFAATFAANAIGLAGIPGLPVDESEATVPIATLVSLSSTMFILSLGLHGEMLLAIAQSYDAFPVRVFPDPAWLLQSLTDAVAETTVLGLRLAAPFAAYAITVNLAMGFAGKFTPQLQVYFVSTGVVVLGGLWVFILVFPDWLRLFVSAYESWLVHGQF